MRKKIKDFFKVFHEFFNSLDGMRFMVLISGFLAIFSDFLGLRFLLNFFHLILIYFVYLYFNKIIDMK